MGATASSSGKQTAAQQVLSTPELLELIFTHLSHCDMLVRGPRVNRTFRDVINSSPKIQKALFFLADTNLTISEPCPFLHTGTTSIKMVFIDKRIKGYTTRDAKAFERGRGSTGSPHRWTPDTDIPLFECDIATPARIEAVMREDASWRKMLIVQPPICQLNFPCKRDSRWVENQDGLRMADLGVMVGSRHNALVINRGFVGSLW